MDMDITVLKPVVPYLRERLANLESQIRDLDSQRIELQKALEALVKYPDIAGGEPKSSSRRPRGANKVMLQTWFKEHPGQPMGQTEMAVATGITASSARAALNRLVVSGFLERDKEGRWCKK